MSQRVHMRALREATPEDGAVECTLQTTAGDGPAVVRETVRQAAAGRCGKHPLARAMRPPIRPQPREDRGRQRDVAVLFAFAVDVHHHPRTVDIGDLETRPFEQPESAGIDRRQTHAVDGNLGLIRFGGRFSYAV